MTDDIPGSSTAVAAIDVAMIQNVLEDDATRPETLAEVAKRIGFRDPDRKRKDPAAALFEANRGVLGSDPARTTAGTRLDLPS